MAPLLDLTKEHSAKVLALGYRLATVQHSTPPKRPAVYYSRQLKGATRLHYLLRRRIELLFIVVISTKALSVQECATNHLLEKHCFEDFVGVVSNSERRPF